jgi:hypothetical protein
VTVVLSTHYLEEAERLADLVHIVDAGPGHRLGRAADLVGPSRGVLLSTAEPVDPAVPRRGPRLQRPSRHRHHLRADRRRDAAAGGRLVRRAGHRDRAAAGHRPLARGRLPGADRVGRCDERYVHAAARRRLPRTHGTRPGALELRLLLRNGEQVLLSLVIPLLLLGFLGAGDGRDIDEVVPGILALAVLSTAFTGLAIGTGFERRYGRPEAARHHLPFPAGAC